MDANFIIFFKQLINGLQIGSVYALIALGYTMVYGIIKLINFAHGDFIMVGGYIIVFTIPFCSAFGIPIYISVIPAIIMCAILAMLVERIAYKPLRGAGSLSSLITALAVSLLLENLCLVLFNSSPRSVPAMFSKDNVALGGISITQSSVLTISISIIVMLILQLFVKKTKLGRSMRAVSEDRQASVLMGVKVNRTISLTFAIGSALAAVGSLMYVASYPKVEPYMGMMLGLKAFIAAVLGGIGSIPGAMVGGFVIGIVESMTKAYINSQLADAFVFGILIIVLLVKPTGLLGKNIGEKV